MDTKVITTSDVTLQPMWSENEREQTTDLEAVVMTLVMAGGGGL